MYACEVEAHHEQNCVQYTCAGACTPAVQYVCRHALKQRIIRRSCYTIIGCQSSAHKPLCRWKIMRNYHGNPWTSLSSLLIPQNTAWQLQLHLPEHILFESTGQKDWGAVLLSLAGAHLRTCSESFTAKISFLDFTWPPVTRKIKARVIQESIVSRVIIDRNTLKIVKYIRVEQRFWERHPFPKF